MSRADRAGPGRASRLAGKHPVWQRLRLAALNRDRWTCRACGWRGHTGRHPGKNHLEVDHVVPCWKLWRRARGDRAAFFRLALRLDAVQVLCRTCHIAKTRRENREWNAGRARPEKQADPERAAWREVVQNLL